MSKETYSLLDISERCEIMCGVSSGKSLRRIAKGLGRSPSTIWREVQRNAVRNKYESSKAQALTTARLNSARSKPRKMHGALANAVNTRLQQQWSPQQISGRLKLEGLMISHETIYKYIWADKKCGGQLFANLRHRGKKYNKRSGKLAGRGLIPGRIDISKRPAIVESKVRVGDWEADTVIGVQHKGALVTLVDRHSKFLLVARVANTTKKVVTAAILKMLKPFKEFVHTITFDNGKEFSDHAKIAKNLGTATYFAKPYHSWERGLNEHNNGLIRQFLPKKTNFLEVSNKFVKSVQKNINSRPRTVLDYKMPFEVFTEATGVALRC
jgi:IS30 family transposase